MATNSPKNRDYFITINESAECYNDAFTIVKETNFAFYAGIYHDKDTKILDDGTIETKAKHLHIMLELQNPVSFESIRKRFAGAHIEVPKYKRSAYQYLLHSSPNSGEKYQYALEEIITNSMPSLKAILESETFEVFKENQFLRYMAEGIRSPYQFTKRFGLNAYKQYWKAYADMLHELANDDEMKRDLDEEIARIEEDFDNKLPF